MKYIVAIVIGFFISLAVFSIVTPVYAQSCNDPGACDQGIGGNCEAGNCVSCTKTVYYVCDPLYPDQLCSCEAQSTCCDNGFCTVCTTDGQCYTNGCPPVDDGGNPPPPPPPPPPPGSTNTPVPPTATPTPITPATIRVVAKLTTPDDTSCAAINASITGVDGTVFGFTVDPPSPQTQTGVTPVEWTNVTPGTYTMTSTPPDPNYAVTYPCLYRNGVIVGYGWSVNANGGETIDWEVGYTYGTPWVQTQGGDVYAASTLRSYIPNVTPRVFNGDSDTGYPGVVTYGTTFDFDSSPTSQGGTLISSTNWQANASRSRINYYDFFYRRYGAPTIATTDPAFSNPLAVTEPPTSDTPYYVVGDITTAGDWSVGNNESIVILVDGNLTLGGRVNITGTGFIAFIVNGTITVSDAVGTTSASTTPVVEGVYVAMKEDLTGSFNTGTSVAASTARFVGKGMFIADGFVLGRDLEGFGVGNTGAAAELFTYNPQLLFTMPDTMKELSVTWSEVAP